MGQQVDYKEERFSGIIVSKGIAIAPIHYIQDGVNIPINRSILTSDIAIEIAKLEIAINTTIEQIQELELKIKTLTRGSESEIFEAHLIILNDQSFLAKIHSYIKQCLCSADYAFYVITKQYIDILQQAKEDYLAQRSQDIQDILNRVLANYHKSQNSADNTIIESKLKNILIADNLSPSQTASLNKINVQGFVLREGSVNSHASILAKSLGIPALIQVGKQLDFQTIKQHRTAIIDSFTGTLILSPTAETLAHYQQKKATIIFNKKQAFADSRAHKLTKTADGNRIIISANIEFEDEAGIAKEVGAEGVGLFRTEFFLLDQDYLHAVERQEAIYRRIIASFTKDLVVIRTLDSGGDKLTTADFAQEENPFLGTRGIRISLQKPDIFKIQIAAILQASTAGKAAIILPMISNIDEIITAKNHINEVKQQLKKRGVSFADNVQIGIMVETPAIAIIADKIAPHVDFFSIGTNDLVQYTVAVDRTNDNIKNLYQNAHPAVIQLIKLTVMAAKKQQIWVGLCGEMASNLFYIPLLVGLGIDELSVSMQMIPAVKQVISNLNSKDAIQLVEQLTKLSSADEIYQELQLFAQTNFPQLIDLN